jgi:predicted nucleic acid-binding Zn ribbon protein
MDKPARKRRFSLAWLLLLVPYAAMMFVPSYNRIQPELAGIPFFYWYQLLWIVIGALILLPVWFGERE